MAVANGFGKVATSGSVFMYDTGDTVNSYRGEPTTNTVGNLNSYNPLDLYTWASTGNTSTWSRDTSAPLSPVKGIPLKEVSSGTDSYSDTYNTSQDNISAASSGQTWTVSVYALANAGTNIQIWIFGANSSGNYVELAANGFTATGQWQRISVTMTFSNGSTAYVQSRVATSTNGGVIWWDGLQVEQKPNPTQFTVGTRSATQGLLPLVGNSTINLSSVSFDSNAQIVFDGTDDKINCGTFSVPYLTVSTWVYKTASTTNQGICRKESGWAVSQYNGTLQVAPGTSWNFYDTGYVIPLNTWVNIAYTYSGTGGSDSQSVYINGNRIFTNSNGSGPITSNSNTVNVGYDDNNWFWNGYIANTIIYNRALTAAEVQQNYNKYKTRFNLS